MKKKVRSKMSWITIKARKMEKRRSGKKRSRTIKKSKRMKRWRRNMSRRNMVGGVGR